MDFEQVIQDVEKLIGKRLPSIRPGAEITLLRVDRKNHRIELETKRGARRFRPLSELHVIWQALQNNVAVHVEKVLEGSGSSRNQPETILANLPYIEYFHDRVKHIAYVKKHTHPYGTIKKMDPLLAQDLRLRLPIEQLPISAVIVDSDVMQRCSNLQRATGLQCRALDIGLYSLPALNSQMIVAHPDLVSETIGEGVYPVISVDGAPQDRMPVLRVGSVDVYMFSSVSPPIGLVFDKRHPSKERNKTRLAASKPLQ